MTVFKTRFHLLAPVLIPDDALPCPPSVMVEKADAFYDKQTCQWIGWYQKADSACIRRRSNAAGILNKIAQEISKSCGTPLTRKYSPYIYHPEVVYDASDPLFAIVPNDYSRSDIRHSIVKYDVFMAYAVSKIDNYIETEDGELADNVRTAFITQETRMYMTVCIFKDTTLKLLLYDRSGLIMTDKIDIHKDKEDFLRVAVGLLFVPEKYLGYDPSIKTVDGKRMITVKKKNGVPLDLEIKETLFHSYMIYGQGMTIWRACGRYKDDNNEIATEREFIIRDYWIEEKNMLSGIDKLEKLEDVSHVAQTWMYEDMGERTKDFRQHGELYEFRRVYGRKYDFRRYDEFDHREHRRCVLDISGTPIEMFRSSEELVHAFLNIFLMIIDLYDKHRVLHRDINPNNLLFVGNNDRRECYIVGTEYTICQIEDRARECLRERAGAIPFMSCDMLEKSSTFEHRYYHDLESAFYALIYICISGRIREDKLLFALDPTWVNSSSIRDIATVRHESLSPEYFKLFFLDRFPRRLKYIKKYIKELRGFLFPPLRDPCWRPFCEKKAIPKLYTTPFIERDISAVRQEIYEIHMRAFRFLEKKKDENGNRMTATGPLEGESSEED